MIAKVAAYHLTQPFPLLRNLPVPALAQGLFHFLQRRSHAVPARMALQLKIAMTITAAGISARAIQINIGTLSASDSRVDGSRALSGGCI